MATPIDSWIGGLDDGDVRSRLCRLIRFSPGLAAALLLIGAYGASRLALPDAYLWLTVGLGALAAPPLLLLLRSVAADSKIARVVSFLALMAAPYLLRHLRSAIESASGVSASGTLYEITSIALIAAGSCGAVTLVRWRLLQDFGCARRESDAQAAT